MSASLQRRISIGVIANTAGVVLIAAVGIWFANRSWLLQGLDRELLARAERVHRLDALPAGDWKPRPWLLLPETKAENKVDNKAENKADNKGDNKAESDDHIDLRRPILVMDATTGKVILQAAQLPADFAKVLNPANHALQSVHVSADLHLRLMAVLMQRGLPISSAENLPVIVYLASDLQPIEDELAHLAKLLSALWVTALVLAWISVGWSGRVVLRPLKELSLALDHLGPDDLASRLPSAAGPHEFRGMVDRLNLLLDRLEQAFRREQATIKVIAHELRTPVATLRTAIEFRQLIAEDAGEKAVLATCFRTIERMQAMVTNLLLLARLEAGKEPLPRMVVDLVEMVHDALADRPDISAELPASALVLTSPMHLRLVLDNLIGNAVAHGQPPGRIQVVVEGTSVHISNPCAEGIDTSQLGTVFYRADAARSNGDHCGLGLALVTRLVRLLDGQLTLTAAGHQFRAEVRLPAGT